KIAVFKGACSTKTLSQSISSSSATIMGMDVFTFCPISGFGDIIVARPLSPIFRYPFISNHSFGILATSLFVGLQDASQLKPTTSPPPANAEVLRNDLLPYDVFIKVTVPVFEIK